MVASVGILLPEPSVSSHLHNEPPQIYFEPLSKHTCALNPACDLSSGSKVHGLQGRME